MYPNLKDCKEEALCLASFEARLSLSRPATWGVEAPWGHEGNLRTGKPLAMAVARLGILSKIAATHRASRVLATRYVSRVKKRGIWQKLPYQVEKNGSKGSVT